MKKGFYRNLVLVIVISLVIISVFYSFATRNDRGKFDIKASSSSTALTSQADWNGYSTKTNIDLAGSPGSFDVDDKGTSAVTGGSFSHYFEPCVENPDSTPDHIADGDTLTVDHLCATGRWIEWDFSASKVISQIKVMATEIDTDPMIAPMYSFRYWDGASWIEIFQESVAGGGVYTTHNVSPSITTDKVRLYHIGESGTGDDELAVIQEVQVLSLAEGKLVTGATQIDGGDNFFEWESFTPTQTVPANTTVTYRYRTSSNGTDWTSWVSSIASATSCVGDTKYRYLQVEATLTNTDGTSTPTIDSYTIGYHTNLAPSTPTAMTAVVGE